MNEGLYLYAHNGTLFSGPPHEYYDKKYADLQVKTGGRITVLVDFTAQTVDLNVNGHNFGRRLQRPPGRSPAPGRYFVS